MRVNVVVFTFAALVALEVPVHPARARTPERPSAGAKALLTDWPLGQQLDWVQAHFRGCRTDDDLAIAPAIPSVPMAGHAPTYYGPMPALTLYCPTRAFGVLGEAVFNIVGSESRVVGFYVDFPELPRPRAAQLYNAVSAELRGYFPQAREVEADGTLQRVFAAPYRSTAVATLTKSARGATVRIVTRETSLSWYFGMTPPPG